MKHFLSVPLALLAIAACGDSTSTGPDADVEPGVDAAPPPMRAVVVAGDFMPGSPGVLSVVDIETRTVMKNVGPAMAVDHDPVLRKHGDELFVVGRGQNTVTILDAADLSFVEQLSTGAGSNPQDVAVSGGRLFVATYGGKGLVELTRGSTTITEIDLAADDPDGQPNCTSIAAIGDELFVSCGLLDNTQGFPGPRGPGKVYVVDPVSRAVARTITLSTANPITLLEQVPPGGGVGDLLIATVTFSPPYEGCVERVAGDSTSSTCLIDNEVLAGYASRLGFQPGSAAPQKLWMIATDTGTFAGTLRSYDLATSTLSPPISSGQALLDLAVCPNGDIVVSDAPFGEAPGGLRIYRDGAEVTTALLDVGLKPTSSAGIVCY